MFELRKSFGWISEACAPKGAARVNKRTEVPRNDCFDSVLKSMNPKVKILVSRSGPLSHPKTKKKHKKRNGRRRKQKAGGKQKRALQSGLRKKAKVVMCEIRVRLVGVSSKGSLCCSSKGCALGGRTRPKVASLFVVLSALCPRAPYFVSPLSARRLCSRFVPPPSAPAASAWCFRRLRRCLALLLRLPPSALRRSRLVPLRRAHAWCSHLVPPLGVTAWCSGNSFLQL